MVLVRELKFKKLLNVEGVPATNYSVSLIKYYFYILCANIHPFSHCSQDPGQTLSFNTREETRRLRLDIVWLLLACHLCWKTVLVYFLNVIFYHFSLCIKPTLISVRKLLCLEPRPWDICIIRCSIFVYCSRMRSFENCLED